MNRSWILTQLAKKYMKKLTTKTILEAQKAYEKYATMPLYEAQKELKDAPLWFLTALMIGSYGYMKKDGSVIYEKGKKIKSNK